MLGDDSLGLHAGQHSTAGDEEVAGGSALHRFDPDGVGVDVDAHYLVVVAAARASAKLALLIRVRGVAGIVNVEEYVFFFGTEGGVSSGVLAALAVFVLLSSFTTCVDSVAGALTFLVDRTP